VSIAVNPPRINVVTQTVRHSDSIGRSHDRGISNVAVPSPEIDRNRGVAGVERSRRRIPVVILR